jgi:hypothetical protein
MAAVADRIRELGQMIHVPPHEVRARSGGQHGVKAMRSQKASTASTSPCACNKASMRSTSST